MPAADVLRTMRGSDYGSTKPDEPGKEGMDSDQPNETPRMVSLTDDEQKQFAQAKPGEDLACEVHGTLEDDGHFHIMSIQPLSGGSYGGGDDEKAMAGQVAQRVVPGMSA